jgi:hypothetical protein
VRSIQQAKPIFLSHCPPKDASTETDHRHFRTGRAQLPLFHPVILLHEAERGENRHNLRT